MLEQAVPLEPTAKIPGNKNGKGRQQWGYWPLGCAAQKMKSCGQVADRSKEHKSSMREGALEVLEFSL